MLTVRNSIISFCQYCNDFSFAETVINMASTSRTVREDVGMIEICMTLSSSTGRYTSCPVEFDFSVFLVTVDGNAGNSITSYNWFNSH